MAQAYNHSMGEAEADGVLQLAGHESSQSMSSASVKDLVSKKQCGEKLRKAVIVNLWQSHTCAYICTHHPPTTTTPTPPLPANTHIKESVGRESENETAFNWENQKRETGGKGNEAILKKSIPFCWSIHLSSLLPLHRWGNYLTEEHVG